MFKRKYSVQEISQYVRDLKEMNVLRDKARASETATYDNIIKIMQITLERISGKV